MRRRRQSGNEISNHPFRSLFDLMLALVFMLLIAVALQNPSNNGVQNYNDTYNARQRKDELLFLHNMREKKRASPTNKFEPCESWEQLKQRLTPGDNWFLLAEKDCAMLSASDRVTLETGRAKLWNDVDENVKILVKSEPLVSRLGQDRLQFPSGEDVPRDQSHLHSILEEARNHVIYRGFRRIRVEGHTDSVPVPSSSRFHSNWELSAARAIWLTTQIENYLRQNPLPRSVSSPTIEAIGYGERKPIRSNDTEPHRQENRRIEIKYEQ